MVKHAEVAVRTRERSQWIDITKDIQCAISESGIQDGICNASSLHTTAGMTINENADPDVGQDFFSFLSRMVPQDPSFAHNEGNSDSHIKASLVGLSVQIPIMNGNLVLGTWQSVYFCEFDGPRSRRVAITIISD